MSLRILDRKALRAKGILYCNVHLLRLERQDKFPKRFNLTENRVAWLEEEIDAWITERVTARRTADRWREAAMLDRSPEPALGPEIEDQYPIGRDVAVQKARSAGRKRRESDNSASAVTQDREAADVWPA